MLKHVLDSLVDNIAPVFVVHGKKLPGIIEASGHDGIYQFLDLVNGGTYTFTAKNVTSILLTRDEPIITVSSLV